MIIPLTFPKRKKKRIVGSYKNAWDVRGYTFTSHYSFLRCMKYLPITPKWADIAAIEAIYAECKRLNKIYYKENNIPRHTKKKPRIAKWHVDHFIPVKGKNVCGLHVETNLRIITGKENMSKGNKYN
jgi:hypothetical protein